MLHHATALAGIADTGPDAAVLVRLRSEQAGRIANRSACAGRKVKNEKKRVSSPHVSKGLVVRDYALAYARATDTLRDPQ